MSKEQTVSRSGKSRAARFARIDNAVLQHNDLSFRARGVLAYVLSMPATWRHSAKSLSSASPDGMSAIRRAMRELDAAGFATLQKVREKGGRVVNRWVFRETPSAGKLHPVSTSPSTENCDPVEAPPSMRLPGPGGPGPGKPALLETTIHETTWSETTEKETTRGSSKPPAPVLFPFSEFTDLPAELQGRLRSIGLRLEEWDFQDTPAPLEWWQARFNDLRGRKLSFKDKHSAADWPAVVEFELRKCAEATKGKGRGPRDTPLRFIKEDAPRIPDNLKGVDPRNVSL